MKRSDGAKAGSTVLSELAQVKVCVVWERPTWRVSWLDGPTREALMGRAAAVGRYRVGAPLPFEDLRFARSHIGVAVALVWLAPGESGVPGHGAGGDRRGRGVLCGHGLPADPFRRGRAGGRRVAGRVGHGDIAEMGVLLASPGCATGRGGGHAGGRSGTDRPGGHLPLAGRRPA